MRHLNRTNRFAKATDHRLAILSNMSASLIECERIQTTIPKAKALRPVIERLITLAKSGDLHSRRRALSILDNKKIPTQKLFNVLGPRFKGVNGGYVRILRTGFRKGDVAPLAFVVFSKLGEPATQPAKGSKAAPAPK